MSFVKAVPIVKSVALPKLNLSVDARRLRSQTEQYAPAIASLMTPLALTGYTLAFWRLGADLNWVSRFFVENGLFSRWQVWLALGILAHAGAHQIGRFGRSRTSASS